MTGITQKTLLGLLLFYLLAILTLGFLWDTEPEDDPLELAKIRAETEGTRIVPGFMITATAIELAEILLNKRGGYQRNDIMPPGVWADNIPEWELGVIVQVRDLVRVMRNDLSRSQSQSQENPELVKAEGSFFFSDDSWILPATETEYRTGIKALKLYLKKLSDPQQTQAQFFARADNLRDWLQTIDSRLGSLSQRLSASVGKRGLNLNVTNESDDNQEDTREKTPWLEIDNVFFETRGQSYALLHFLRAVEVDFERVLRDKNATVSLRQIIRELEATQNPLRSPLILNGEGFGFWANHSLVMASHISRANAAIIDLRRLMADG